MFGGEGWLWKEQDERPAAAPGPVVNPVGASRERPLTRHQRQRDQSDLHHAVDIRVAEPVEPLVPPAKEDPGLCVQAPWQLPDRTGRQSRGGQRKPVLQSRHVV